MKNVFPESTAMDSADFLCFFLFLIVSLPLILVPPEHYRKPFLFTAVSSTITCFSIFIWSLARAGGGGPFISGSVAEITGVEPVKGSYLVSLPHRITKTMGGETDRVFVGLGYLLWHFQSDGRYRGWCECKMTHSYYETPLITMQILNMSDYTRFAVRPKDQVLSQVVVVPIMGVSALPRPQLTCTPISTTLTPSFPLICVLEVVIKKYGILIPILDYDHRRRYHLHLRRCRVLPRARSTMAALRSIEGYPGREWLSRCQSRCILCL